MKTKLAFGICVCLIALGCVLVGESWSQARDGSSVPQISVPQAETPHSLGLALTARRWSPYVVGFGIGLLVWLSFLLSNKTIGASGAYAKSAGMLEALVRSDSRQKAYYQKFVPKIDWEWMLVAGLIVGAFVSAVTSGDFRVEWVPPTWDAAAGHTPFLRWLTALIGGIILAIGARLAGGCTSGHGISGTLQLVVISWVATLCFFVSGVATAFIIYRIIL